MEIKFKFNLKDKVIKKSKENQTFIIIGRMEAIEQPIRYLIQSIESYNKDGYRFDKGSWEYENQLILIK